MKSIGLQRTGGKFFLVKKLVPFARSYKVFLSLFSGACWTELEFERATVFEQWNDIDRDLMNYLEIISNYPAVFDSLKKGYYGLIYDKTLERFKKDLEIPFDENMPLKMKIRRAYAYFYVNKLTVYGQLSKISIPKLNRPHTNQDQGLLTKLNPKSIERMNYVHLTSKDFEKCYEKFCKHFYNNHYKVKPEEVLLFVDKPYIEQNVYNFSKKQHRRLAQILNETDFSFMMTCRNSDFNRRMFEGDSFFFSLLKTRYPSNVHSEDNKGVVELLITNYDVEELGRSIPRMRLTKEEKKQEEEKKRREEELARQPLISNWINKKN